MKKINEADFVSFTIEKGWSLTMFSIGAAVREFAQLSHGNLYGNKPDGSRELLDSK